MSLSDAQMQKLKRMAAKELLEVEHLLKLARTGDSADVPFLQSLKMTNSWSDSGIENGKLVVPFARWTDVVCAFLEGGYERLVSLAIAPDTFKDYCTFCMAVLEEVKTPQSVRALMDIAQGLEALPAKDMTVSLVAKVASALNSVLSFKGAPPISTDMEHAVRAFLQSLLGAGLQEHELACVILALRGVGDESSIQQIAAMPPLDYSVQNASKVSIRVIKKRLRQRGHESC